MKKKEKKKFKAPHLPILVSCAPMCEKDNCNACYIEANVRARSQHKADLYPAPGSMCTQPSGHYHYHREVTTSGFCKVTIMKIFWVTPVFLEIFFVNNHPV